MCSVSYSFSEILQQSRLLLTTPPLLNLYCIIVKARNRWSHIRSSMASFLGRVGAFFIHKSASYAEAQHDSGLSLMVTALSSLATKLEEMG